MKDTFVLPLGVTRIDQRHTDVGRFRVAMGAFVYLTITVMRVTRESYRIHLKQDHDGKGSIVEQEVGGLQGDTHCLLNDRRLRIVSYDPCKSEMQIEIEDLIN